MTAPKHTPTPQCWHCDAADSIDGDTCENCFSFQFTDVEDARRIVWSRIESDQDASEAFDFICVRAVNSHAALVEALREAQDLILRVFTRDLRDQMPEWYEVSEKARAALALAEGE